MSRSKWLISLLNINNCNSKKCSHSTFIIAPNKSELQSNAVNHHYQIKQIETVTCYRAHHNRHLRYIILIHESQNHDRARKALARSTVVLFSSFQHCEISSEGKAKKAIKQVMKQL